MPSTQCHSYNLNFKLKIVAEAEAVKNNREIAREYGISESMVRKWRNQQHMLFNDNNQQQARNHVLIRDILEENIFLEAVHIDKSQVPFNALTKKGQLITVCLRATCKDINQISLENMSKEEWSPPNLTWQEHQIYKLSEELLTKFWEITQFSFFNLHHQQFHPAW